MSKKRKTYEDPPHLQGEDPRHYMVSVAPTGVGLMYMGASVPQGGRIVSFGIPSPAALCLSIAHRAWIRSEASSDLFHAPNGYFEAKDHGVLFDVFEDRLENIVFSFTAIEMFANSVLPEGYSFRAPRDDRRCTEEYSREQVERSLNIEKKLDAVLPGIRGVHSPKGTSVWDQFIKLNKLRDRVIHLKWDDVRKAGPEKNTLWSELVRTLHRDFSRDAHDLIAHYCVEGNTSRWTKAFPYAPRRP